MSETKNIEQRQRSGSFNSSDKLTCLLYLLMRDHLPAGIVEELVRSVEDEKVNQFTNGWLALYAQDLKNRLK